MIDGCCRQHYHRGNFSLLHHHLFLLFKTYHMLSLLLQIRLRSSCGFPHWRLLICRPLCWSRKRHSLSIFDKLLYKHQIRVQVLWSSHHLWIPDWCRRKDLHFNGSIKRLKQISIKTFVVFYNSLFSSLMGSSISVLSLGWSAKMN